MSTLINLARPITDLFATVPEFVTLAQLSTALGIRNPDRQTERVIRDWMHRQGWRTTVRRVDGLAVRGYMQPPARIEHGAFSDFPVAPDYLLPLLQAYRRAGPDEDAAGKAMWNLVPGLRRWMGECIEAFTTPSAERDALAAQAYYYLGLDVRVPHDARDLLCVRELHRIGAAIGYGRAQQLLGQIWDHECDCAPRGSMGVTVRDKRPVGLSRAVADVLAERERQVASEGWTPEHDDGHVNDEIAAMACFYAMPPGAREWSAEDTGYGDTFGEAIIPEGWEAKEGDRRRELVKAGALILAEIERLDRHSQGQETQS